jgi:hypothetical protein
MKKETKNSILNYPNYYSAGSIEYGKHGPEEKDGEIYLSVFHYLEFNRLNPRDYNTFKLGQALASLTSDSTACKYSNQSFQILKYPYSFIQSNDDLVESFKKT